MIIWIYRHNVILYSNPNLKIIYIPTDHYRGRREFGTNGNARKLIANATQG